MLNNVLQRKVPWKSVDISLMYLLEFIWENKLQIYIRKKKSEYYVIFSFHSLQTLIAQSVSFFSPKKMNHFSSAV